MGYLRDDNSLIKGLPKSLSIISPKQPLYNNHKIDKGFVASHVWRKITNSSVGADLSTRDPILNSFVPNMVWLPSQVSKLSDREGTFTQLYLQALSAKIYKNIPVPTPLIPYVDKAWSMVEIPKGIPSQGLPDIGDLSFFEPGKRFLSTRRKRIEIVIQAFEDVAKGKKLEKKVYTTRYGDGISLLPLEEINNRHGELKEYFDAVLAVEHTLP